MKCSARYIFSISMIMTFLSYQRSAQDELATERKPLTTESEVAAKMHIRYPSYLLQQGEPSNIVLKKRLPQSNFPTTKHRYWVPHLHPISPSFTFHLVMSPSFTISLDQSSPRISAKSRSGPLRLGIFFITAVLKVRLVSDPATNPNRDDSGSIPLTKASFRSWNLSEKSLTPGLPTFLGIAGCHTKIRHLSLEKHHKKLLLGSAQQIGWEWWTVRLMNFCSN